MKKLLRFLTFLFVLLFAVNISSCKSTDQDDESGDAENIEVIDLDDEDDADAKKEAKKAAKEAKKKEKEAQKEAKKKKTSGFDSKSTAELDFGDKNPEWTEQGSGSTQGTVVTEIGSVRIKAIGKLGTFNIYYVDEYGKATPVFATGDEFTTTSFYLMCGKKTYKLGGGLDVMSSAEKTETGVKIRYFIRNIGDVVVDLSIMKSDQKSQFDMVKISSTVKSFAQKTDVFGLKLILDTVLGEKARYHFYNSENIPIKQEILYRNAKTTKLVTSKNNNTSLQILLEGADISPIDFTALASYKTLNTRSWEPNMLTERAFSTVSSYNNSAVQINFIPEEIEPDDERSYLFYLALGSEEYPPKGMEYLIANTIVPEEETEGEEAALEGEGTSDGEGTSKGEVADKTSDGDAKTEAQKTETVKTETKDGHSKEYVQKLLSRIAELEEDDPLINEEEIRILNDELDEILNELRKR